MDTQPTGAANKHLKLLANRYGKSRVRLVKVSRYGSRHELRELTVQVLCQGDFDSSYRDGDNTKVLPTDTMKNTVYALAKREGVTSIEAFGQILATHFLANNPQIGSVRIKIAEDLWSRIVVDGKPHGSAFLRNGGERRNTRISMSRDAQTIESGISGLTILKSSKSAFEGYPKDAFTTLPETSDRIFATSLRATWRYCSSTIEFDKVWTAVRQTILESFAEHESHSVQHTVYAIAEAVLAAHTAVEQIHITMPNRHCVLIDLSRFGMMNQNEIFVPTDEPHGYIEARLARG
jgi:urate oxidase